MKQRILLTGGSGFIGKNILESFLNDKYEIIAPGSKELNLMDEVSVDAFLKKQKFDFVIHSAVKPSHRNAKDFSDIFYTNTRFFFNLEKYSDRYNKMLVLGSGAIYDNRNYRPKMKEEEWKDHIPTDDHGYCKYVCSKVIEHSNNIYDLRIFGVFGKYEDYAIRFISNAICKTLFDLPVTINQNRKFDYIYVNDLMFILDWFLENKPQSYAYNVTPDYSISLYDIALLVKEISGKDIPVIVAEEGMGLEYSGDNSRLKKEMPDFKLTPIKESIKELYAWYSLNKSNIDRNLLLIDR